MRSFCKMDSGGSLFLTVVTFLFLTQASIIRAQTDSLENRVDPYRFLDSFDPSTSIQTRFPAPKGYHRIDRKSLTGFGRWLTRLPMLPPGETVANPFNQFVLLSIFVGGVVDVPLISNSYDARGILNRLGHDYARHMERELEIYHPGRGDDSIVFERWITGKYRTNANYTKLIWDEGEQRAIDGGEMTRFTDFSNLVTSYATLLKECEEITESAAMPGDIFVQIDSSSKAPHHHVVIVIDVVEGDSASVDPDRLILFGNGLTPAASFHILKPIKQTYRNWFAEGKLEEKLVKGGKGKFYRLNLPYLR